ncbi:MAG: HAMP domain-containing sensor histidine kinase [Desulfobacterales bacterium]|nr:HAMP domain-containing sensor histidine kinase [Desulfobacterales bacterium]MDD4072461.1 HAMP domain-containing sensor histidine kinase [Desulfobacterales bacterium]MDD4393159.1 HAMP domain-containing sensor histidine kinase [Desulfobacterales bacterium]
MTRSKWYFHPVLIFIFCILALSLSLFLYIYWYMEIRTGLNAIISRFNLEPENVFESHTWVVILVMSVLVGIILMGILMIFVYHQKTLKLYRLQQTFINNFTHELKTPVTSLKLYLETFIKHNIKRDDQLKFIGYMLKDVSRLGNNINHILNLARIESKSYTAALVSSDVIEAIHHFIRINQHLFPNCNIRIHNRSAQPLWYPIDSSLFEMLLMNLLTNAIKYNSSDTPEVDITIEHDPRNVSIHFTDNGIGIEKTELKKIFKKFYQVGKSDDMSGKGNGLGLYLAQHIARIHKGRIIAESRGPGTGATFTLILPPPEKCA